MIATPIMVAGRRFVSADVAKVRHQNHRCQVPNRPQKSWPHFCSSGLAEKRGADMKQLISIATTKQSNKFILVAALLATFMASASIADPGIRPGDNGRPGNGFHNPGPLLPPPPLPMGPPYGRPGDGRGDGHGDGRGNGGYQNGNYDSGAMMARIQRLENELQGVSERISRLEMQRLAPPPPPVISPYQPPVASSFYCTARCGNDTNTQFGGRGRTQTEAQQAAIEEVRRHFTCFAPTQIGECSQEQ